MNVYFNFNLQNVFLINSLEHTLYQAQLFTWTITSCFDSKLVLQFSILTKINTIL